MAEGEVSIIERPQGKRTELILQRGPEQVGSAVVGPDRKAEDKGLYAQNILVKEGERGKGYGRALMIAVRDVAGERNVRLEVGADNHPAVNLYQSMGYKVEQVTVGRSGETYLRMVNSVDPQ